ncbi:MAG: hypothetical protein AB1491_01805 [Thermodesulfobacteriota bacterium]
METTLILSIIQLALQYGVPGAIGIIKAWEVDPANITDADIANLRAMRPPESYFNTGDPGA